MMHNLIAKAVMIAFALALVWGATGAVAKVFSDATACIEKSIAVAAEPNAAPVEECHSVSR